MNVNIWGPPTWEILHTCAFFLDMYKTESPIFELIKTLLPCVHCRNSYALFYSAMGPPKPETYSSWIIHVHNLVNKKLNSQKIDKLIEKYPQLIALKSIEDEFVNNPPELLIRKRFMVNLDSSFHWRSLSLMILSFAMGVQDNTTRREFDHVKLQSTFKLFLKEIKKIIGLFKLQMKEKDYNYDIELLEKVLDKVLKCENEDKIRSLIETLKYKSVSKYEATFISELIRAYSCFEGTCK